MKCNEIVITCLQIDEISIFPTISIELKYNLPQRRSSFVKFENHIWRNVIYNGKIMLFIVLYITKAPICIIFDLLLVSYI